MFAFRIIQSLSLDTGVSSPLFVVPFHPDYHQTHTTYYLKDNQGNVWKESKYQGNAIFGGMNYHDLFHKMNQNNSGQTIYPMITTNPKTPWTNQKQTWTIKNKQLSSTAKDIHQYNIFCQEHCFHKQIYDECCIYCNE